LPDKAGLKYGAQANRPKNTFQMNLSAHGYFSLGFTQIKKKKMMHSIY